jgi:hypothetical protein
MTVKVAGLWELGYSAPLTEFFHWHYPLRDFGVSELIMSPISGIQNEGLVEYVDPAAAIQANPDLTVVFVDEKGSEDLETFVHPENALYVFGRANLSAMTAYGRPGDRSLKISTVTNQGLLWPHQVAVLVLYDRFKKQG